MQTRQGEPLTQTKINNTQQEPELHPHDSCARVAPEDRLKHSQPQTRDKENNVFSNLTDYVKNIDEKEPVKGLHGSGVRVAFEDSLRRYAEPEYQSRPPTEEQGGNVMEHLTGFIQNIDENEPRKGIHGRGARVAPEDSWAGRAQLTGVADVGSMSTNIDSHTNLDDNEPTEEVKRAGRGAPQENPSNERPLNPVMQNLSGYIRNMDDDEPEKGIFGAGVRVNEEDRWKESAGNEEETVKRAHRARTGPVEGTTFGSEELTSNSDNSQMWRSTGRRVSDITKALGGYVTRQSFQEWHREKKDEPIKCPDGNCAIIDPKDRLGHFVQSYATNGSS